MGGPRRDGERGFSLLELMIAVVILGVLTSQMFVALSAQRRAGTGSERDLDLQESARLVADLIAYDARNAGMMVPYEVTVSSVDGSVSGQGGAYGSDRFCVSASDFFHTDKPAWKTRTTRFPGATATVINGGASIRIALTDLNGTGNSANIDASVEADTPPNDWNPAVLTAPVTGPIPTVGVILAQTNGQGSWCSRVTSITVSATNLDLNLAVAVNASTPSYNVPAAITGSLIAVPAIIYELVDPTPAPIDNDPLCNLWRNGNVVSTQIEDLQIEYWIDTLGAAGTGLTVVPNGIRDLPGEFPVHRLLGLPAAPAPYTPLSRIRDVRISVIARSPLQSVKSNGLLRGRRPALANHAASAVADAFTRRSYTASVLPRNLLNPGQVSPDVD